MDSGSGSSASTSAETWSSPTTPGRRLACRDWSSRGILDSTEIVSNVIGGNLICHGNTPPAQIGDAILDEGNGPNTVGGNAIGECADVSE